MFTRWKSCGNRENVSLAGMAGRTDVREKLGSTSTFSIVVIIFVEPVCFRKIISSWQVRVADFSFRRLPNLAYRYISHTANVASPQSIRQTVRRPRKGRSILMHPHFRQIYDVFEKRTLPTFCLPYFHILTL